MDEVGGLYFAHARSYDAQSGRFVSEDKVRGFIIMPYTLNHYGYCWNNPKDYVDVDGRFVVSATLVAIGVGIFVGAAGSATGEVVSQTIDGLGKGESLETSLGNINWEKVGVEAIKGGIIGGVAGSGAGLLAVAGTTGVVEFGGSLYEQKFIDDKEKVDVGKAASDGIWAFGSTLVLGGISNEISNIINPKAKIGTMDYLLGRRDAHKVVTDQLNKTKCPSRIAKLESRLENIEKNMIQGAWKYGYVEFGNSLIAGGKDSLYGNQLDEEMSGNINTFIQCEVLG